MAIKAISGLVGAHGAAGLLTPLAGNPVALVVQCLAFALVLGAAWLLPAPVRAVPAGALALAS